MQLARSRRVLMQRPPRHRGSPPLTHLARVPGRPLHEMRSHLGEHAFSELTPSYSRHCTSGPDPATASSAIKLPRPPQLCTRIDARLEGACRCQRGGVSTPRWSGGSGPNAASLGPQSRSETRSCCRWSRSPRPPQRSAWCRGPRAGEAAATRSGEGSPAVDNAGADATGRGTCRAAAAQLGSSGASLGVAPAEGGGRGGCSKGDA